MQIKIALIIGILVLTFPSITHSQMVGKGIYKQHIEDPNKCPLKELTKVQYWNGQLLSTIVGNQVEILKQQEKEKGRDLKVVLIARAGLDMSGVMTLKDVDESGKILTVDDLFKEINRNNYNSDSAQNVSDVQMDLKRNYEDPKRQLVYSHMGMLFTNHPIANMGLKYAGMDMNGDLWIEELLKPCVDLVPRAWATGLDMFFLDDPHDYRALIMVPTQEIQDRLYDILINHKDEYKKYLGKTYNAASRFDHPTDQNSNQYVLEMIVSAMNKNYFQIKDRTQTFKILRDTGYRPTKIIADSFKAFFMTSIFAPKSLNIRPEDNKYSIPYTVVEFVTELSVREYLLRLGVIKPENILEVVLDKKEMVKDFVDNKPVFNNH